MKEFEYLYNYLKESFEKYGVTQKSLGWTKGKHSIRFFQLLRELELSNVKSILDFGCGFGGLVTYLNEIKADWIEYTGIDILEEFVEIAKDRFKDRNNVKFICGNFFEIELEKDYDVMLISGALNYRIPNVDQYSYFEKIMQKASEHAKIFVCDFLSDKVDYLADENNFVYNPSKILEIAYKYSKNIVLRNDALPFEFQIIVNMNDSFSKEATTFDSFLSKYEKIFGERLSVELY